MYNLVNGKKLKIKNECHCVSKVKLKKCAKGLHDKSYRELRMIDKSIIGDDLIKIIDYLKK